MDPIVKFLNNLSTLGFEFVGKYYSSYRGFVVDNKDPEFHGRVKLMVPQVTGSDVINYWAWPKHCFSGQDYGSQVIPRINDMVWVEFEMGSPRKPIWHFGHFAKSPDNTQNEKPKSLQDIDNYWFKTPGGHLIECDDTNKWIKITSSKGGVITLDDNLQLLGNTSPAVLGDKNNALLTDIRDTLKDISDAFSKIASQDTIPVSSLASVTGVTLTYPAVITAALPQIQTLIQGMQTKIDNNNSQKVTLE